MKSSSHPTRGAVTRRITRRAAPAQSDVWSTPAMLRMGLYGAVFASLLMLVAALIGAFTARSALSTIGREAAPGVLASERIRGLLSSMDACAVTELLARNSDPAQFESRRKEAADAIIRATEDIHYQNLERVPLQQLGLGLGSYTAQIQQARDEFKAGDKRYLEAYRHAAKTMDTDLVPSAQRLEQGMRGILESSYARQTQILKSVKVSLTCFALATGFILVYLQFFLSTRMRRVMNPLLLLATLTVIIFAGYSVQNLQQESQDLQSAKEDSFAHESASLQAVASAEAASLDVSRHKLEPAYFGESSDALTRKPEQVSTSVPDFESTIEQGFRDVSGFEWSAPSATLLIVLCSFLGILPRLREYSA